MRKEIYVIVHQPLSNYTSDRFGLNENLYNKIIYLNILPLIDSKIFQAYDNYDFKNENFYNFGSFLSLLKFLSKDKKKFYYVNLAGKNFFSILIEVIFNLQGGTKFDIIQPSLPIVLKKNFHFRKKLFLFNKLDFYKLKNKITDIFQSLIFCLLCKKAQILFVSNNFNFNKFKKNIFVFKINHLDYFNFHKNNKEIQLQKYFCFIDQEQENSFENKLFIKSSYIPDYLMRMSKLLKSIENKTGLKVKIALHHRRGKNIPKEFKSFDCSIDNTVEIIKNSEFVLSHNSTALNLAIMAKKPINLIWLEEFSYRLSKYLSMKKLEQEIDCCIIKEKDALNNFNFQKKINNIKYDKFVDNYINFNEKISFEHPWKTIDKEIGRL